MHKDRNAVRVAEDSGIVVMAPYGVNGRRGRSVLGGCAAAV
jgi:hypothetical protein